MSSLIVPIAYQEGIAGLIHLHASLADHFDTTAIEITQSLATQAAIALGNASRFAEQRQRTALLSRRVETIEKVMEVARSLSSGQPLEFSLETIAFGIQELIPLNMAIVGVCQPETSELIRVSGVGLPLDTLEEYRLEALPWSGVTALLREEYRINQIHFVPQDGFPYTIYEPGLLTTLPVDGVRQTGGRKWLDGDKLLVVINDPDGKPLGLIQVDQPRDGMRPDKPTLESLEIFASQASLVIESHQRLDDLYTQIGNVQAELTSARSALDAKWTAQPIFQQNDTVIETSLSCPPIDHSAFRLL